MDTMSTSAWSVNSVTVSGRQVGATGPNGRMIAATAVLALGLAVLAGTAGAVPTYQVESTFRINAFPVGGPGLSSSTTPGVEQDGFGSLTGTGTRIDAAFFGFAGQGVLRASTSLDTSGKAFGSPAVSRVVTRFIYDDVVISAPALSTDVTIHLHLTGTAGGSSGGDAGIEIGTFLDTRGGRASCGLTFCTGFLTPLVNSSNVDTVLNITFGGVRTNIPVTLQIDLIASANGGDGAFGDGVSSSFANYGNTLTFVTDAPVFTVQGGGTVDSAQAGIVDNRFSLPVSAPPPVGLLAGASLFTIVLRRRADRVKNVAGKR